MPKIITTVGTHFCLTETKTYPLPERDNLHYTSPVLIFRLRFVLIVLRQVFGFRRSTHSLLIAYR